MGNKWRGFVVAAVAATWLAAPAAVQPASAATLTGNFSIAGVDVYDLTAQTISFSAGSTVLAGTGSFAGLVGTPITFIAGCTAPSACDYTTLTGLFFTGNKGLSFTWSGTANFLVGVTPPFVGDLAIGGAGMLTLNGFDPTPGILLLTTQNGGDGTTHVTFSATAVAVPGPVVGAGLPGLVMACGGLLALARRRRQQVAA